MHRLTSVGLTLILSVVNLVAATPARSRPNVILIFSDDQGSVDLNIYGARDLETPHLDSLAKLGVRFTQFYAAAPVCSPSRAGLLTGLYPQRAGVPGNIPVVPGDRGMPPQQLTIAEVMRAAGYVTGHIGKWHLGMSAEMIPTAQGFEYSFGHLGGCLDNYSHFFYWQGPNQHDLQRNGKEVWYDGRYLPDLMVEECIQFLEKNRDRPFFLYWAINMPHYPLQGTNAWRDKYSHLPSPRREYAAFLSTMDERIGAVLAKLGALGLVENTVVIFQSDHGHSTEERTFGGGGNPGPYRGAKFSLFEGGLRVPAIISWPGHVPQNQVRDQFATGVDWFPTILDLCGIRLPSGHKIDGRSLTAVITSPETPSPHVVFHWQTGPGPQYQWAVREGSWKLIGNPRDTSQKAPLAEEDKLFLVDLSQDVGEMKNLAREHPDKVQRLQKLHQEWLADLSSE